MWMVGKHAIIQWKKNEALRKEGKWFMIVSELEKHKFVHSIHYEIAKNAIYNNLSGIFSYSNLYVAMEWG